MSLPLVSSSSSAAALSSSAIARSSRSRNASSSGGSDETDLDAEMSASTSSSSPVDYSALRFGIELLELAAFRAWVAANYSNDQASYLVLLLLTMGTASAVFSSEIFNFASDLIVGRDSNGRVLHAVVNGKNVSTKSWREYYWMSLARIPVLVGTDRLTSLQIKPFTIAGSMLLLDKSSTKLASNISIAHHLFFDLFLDLLSKFSKKGGERALSSAASVALATLELDVQAMTSLMNALSVALSETGKELEKLSSLFDQTKAFSQSYTGAVAYIRSLYIESLSLTDRFTEVEKMMISSNFKSCCAMYRSLNLPVPTAPGSVSTLSETGKEPITAVKLANLPPKGYVLFSKQPAELGAIDKFLRQSDQFHAVVLKSRVDALYTVGQGFNYAKHKADKTKKLSELNFELVSVTVIKSLLSHSMQQQAGQLQSSTGDETASAAVEDLNL